MKKLKRKQVDMHIHSNYSDGDCSIDELIKRIGVSRLKAAVLTDHDSIDGAEKFIRLCEENNIDTMTGIEVSSTYCRFYGYGDRRTWKAELHILGYGYDLNSLSKNNELLYNNQVVRNHHIENMMWKYRLLEEFSVSFIEMTKQFDIPWPLTSKYWLMKSRVIDLMKKEDLGFNEAKAKASKEISSGGKFHAERGNYCSPKEAIELLINHGGVAVWAHPLIYLRRIEKLFTDDTIKIFEKTLKELKDYGLYGLEVYSQHHPKEDKKLLLEYCDKYKLDSNFGGSDYHGDEEEEHTPGGTYLGKGGISYDQFLKPRIIKHKK